MVFILDFSLEWRCRQIWRLKWR